MRGFLEKNQSGELDKNKKRRTAEISCLRVRRNIWKYARAAERKIVQFINENELDIRTVMEYMSGRGEYTSYLLQINGLEEIILNDMAPDCYELLLNKFRDTPLVTEILNRNFFEFDLEKPTDLIVIDFNNFTWNKEDLAKGFHQWINRNRNTFKYLLYTDSFHFSLKFKPKESRNEKFFLYRKRVEKELKMKLITYVNLGNGDCSLILLER
jgi:hypothetical protein